MIETLIGGALVFVGVVTGMFAIRFQPHKVGKPEVDTPSSGDDAATILGMNRDRERINKFISKKMIKIHELLMSSRDDLPSAVAEEIDDLVVEVIDFLSPKGEV